MGVVPNMVNQCRHGSERGGGWRSEDESVNSLLFSTLLFLAEKNCVNFIL